MRHEQVVKILMERNFIKIESFFKFLDEKGDEKWFIYGNNVTDGSCLYNQREIPECLAFEKIEREPDSTQNFREQTTQRYTNILIFP